MIWLKATQIPGLRDKLGVPLEKSDDYLEPYSWVNAETGSKIHVINKGGWRHPKTSSIRVFVESPSGIITDVTAEFGDTGYYTTEIGADTYSEVFDRVRKQVEALLGL